MDTFESALIAPPATLPPRGNPLLRFLVHHNPFYLLSALSMIAGCYALNNALQTRSGELSKLLLLMGTLQLYELLLVGLGLFLIVKCRLDRDGRTLLLLDAVFLVDLTFLNAETAATSLRTGLLVNGVTLLLALGKVAVVMAALSVRFPRRAFGFMTLQLVVLLGTPCVLKWAERPGTLHSGITALQLYAAWWVAGLLPVAFEAMRRLTPSGGAQAAVPGVRRDVLRVYAIAPFVSLVAHLGMLHYVYNVPWHMAYAAPVLLGVATIVPRFAGTELRPAACQLLALGLPATAILFSLHHPDSLAFKVTTESRTLTPVTLTAEVAYVVYVYVLAVAYAAWYLAAGVVAATAYLFGPAPSQCIEAVQFAWNWTVNGVRRRVPKTSFGWGVIAVACSFGFLLFGALLSLKKRATGMPAETPMSH